MVLRAQALTARYGTSPTRELVAIPWVAWPVNRHALGEVARLPRDLRFQSVSLPVVP
jgi:hypothetical protein